MRRNLAVQASLVELTVTDQHDGLRLDHFLTALLPGRSRSQNQRLIREGLVRVGPKVGRTSTAVRTGEMVTLVIPPPTPARLLAQALPIEIIYEDADLLVVDKPAGMVVHPAPGHAAGTLVNALLHQTSDLSGIGGEQRPGIVHRLDRGTSGLMVVAKHDASHAELARQFQAREVEKEYVALVWGVVQAGRRIDAPLGRDPAHRQRMSTRARRARSAVTRITKAEHLRGVSLLGVALATGRTHQIRAHLGAIGHPVIGDSLYGGQRRHLPAHLSSLAKLERPFLHAARLGFSHPRDGYRVEFTCDLPSDLEAILSELRNQPR